MTYHVHTEDRSNLAELTSKYFQGFTLMHAQGYWDGISEPAAIIEIATDDKSQIIALAEDIKRTNMQQAVMIEEYATTKTAEMI